MSVLAAMVLAGDGINCERETADACAAAGFLPRILHVNDLLAEGGAAFERVKLVVLPGGFSFGDELGSGKILALKLRHGLGDSLETYLARGGALLGICNGFQVMARLGLFGPRVTLAGNTCGHFLDRWVGLEITGRSIFTDGLRKAGVTRMELPIRHGEGRVVGVLGDGVSTVFRYETDVNGSQDRIAGLAAHGGRVLGLMPHPEAFWTEELHPWGTGRGVPLGTELFVSARRALGEGA